MRLPLPRPATDRACAMIEPLEGRTLLSFAPAVVSAGGQNALAVGDLNADGRADLVVCASKIHHHHNDGGANYTAALLGNPVVRLDRGHGHFRVTATLAGAKGDLLRATAGPTGSPADALSIADANGDGRPDVRLRTLRRGPTPLHVDGTTFFEYVAYDNVWLQRKDGSFGPVTTRRSRPKTTSGPRSSAPMA
jgi:hypothetical protein